MRRLLVVFTLALALVAPAATPLRAAPLAAPGGVITKHPGSVGRNRMATLAAKTRPGSLLCRITVLYKSGPARQPGWAPRSQVLPGGVVDMEGWRQHHEGYVASDGDLRGVQGADDTYCALESQSSIRFSARE